MSEFVTVKSFHGLCSMIVCGPKAAVDKDILAHCNEDNLAGTTNGWMSVVRNDEEHPQRNPVVCDDDSGRLHFIVDC